MLSIIYQVTTNDSKQLLQIPALKNYHSLAAELGYDTYAHNTSLAK